VHYDFTTPLGSYKSEVENMAMIMKPFFGKVTGEGAIVPPK
jgi:hypothetical protein